MARDRLRWRWSKKMQQKYGRMPAQIAPPIKITKVIRENDTLGTAINDWSQKRHRAR